MAKQTTSTTTTKAVFVAVVDVVPAEFVLGKNKAQLFS